MAKRNWTKDQADAINARGGTILVSAAAGSGKTAVLVERVIERIVNPQNPCDADKLLMVTFTRAAAAEMRERIAAALAGRLEADPMNAHLRRQQMLLPQAKICTMDSFCNDLVRENFHRLGVAPDYKILDGSEQEVLEHEAIDEILEELYGEGSPAFEELLDLFLKGRSDEQLGEAITRIYKYTQAYPFPEQWLSFARSLYSAESKDSRQWARIALEYVCSACRYSLHTLRDAADILEQVPELSEKYSPAIQSDISQIKNILELSLAEEWDEAMNAVLNFNFAALGRVPKAFSGSPEQVGVKDRRDRIKKLIKEKVAAVFCASSEENEEDLNALQPVANKLFDAVELFSARYNEKKRERNSLEFADIEHLALQLLIEKDDNNNISRTPLAKEISNSYEEILLDEYQDTNEAQDSLFWAISKDNNNLFMVGDVKQSIYRFRQAMPEIFLTKRKALPLYTGKEYPARINLDRNFRSRAGVAGMVNFTFHQLMSEQMGEMEYTAEEELVPAAAYPESPTPDVELHLVLGSDDEDLIESEARHAAFTIQRLMKEGTLVQSGGEQRPLQYRDICVLLRSTKDTADKYVEVLNKNGVPAWTETKGGFFGVTEIRVMLALLRILDNPVQDVPLLSVMMSPIYGFTPDDIAKIRLADRRAPLYTCVVKSAEGDERCREFINSISSLRRLSATLTADELIRRIYEETGYPSIVGVMPDARRRRANLRLLLTYAAKYESAGYKGLPGLIHFIDRLEQRRADLATASDLSESANVVRIMSIHKSKGLEFPVCIIGNCSKKFNDQSRRGDMLLQSGLGVGLKRRDKATLRRFTTLPHTAARLSLERSELSEELRVLYVAMTRAREKLILMVGENKDFSKRLRRLASGLTSKTEVEPFSVRMSGSYGDWLLTAALRHPDSVTLRNMAELTDLPIIKSGFTLRIEQNDCDEFTHYNTDDEDVVEYEPIYLDEIRKKLRYKYPYSALSSIVSKRAASDVPERKINEEFFASARPSFMEAKGLTAAQKGTAMHKYLQFADYKNASQNPEAERDRLIEKGFLSDIEGKSIDFSRIRNFFNSELGKQILSAKKVWREFKFEKLVSAERYAPGLEIAKDEVVLVQGISDCVFERDGKIIIVDYKTDRVKTSEELVGRYKHQLEVYSEALSACLGMPVLKTVLYSFSLQQAVEVIL